MSTGIEIQDLRPGSGPAAGRGQRVTIRYTGFLNRGDKFQENITCTFRVGGREVIAGLARGVEGMRAGGLRRIRVSPHLGYGSAGVPGLIPANAVLIFEVELMEVSGSGSQPVSQVSELEQKHAEGYTQRPVEPGEFDAWEAEQAWDEE